MPGVSERDPKDRANIGALVDGMIGSGKSRMCLRLAVDHWQRIIAIDPTGSFATEKNGFEVTTNYEMTVRALQFKFMKEPFKIAAVYDTDEEYERLFAGLVRLFREAKGRERGLLIIVDEVDKWSGPMTINEDLSRVLRFGRHSCISWIVACRADVQTNRDVRMNATGVIMFKQGMLSEDARKMIKSAEVIRKKPIPPVETLTKHGRDEPDLAVEDVHFVCIPDTWDEFEKQWADMAKLAQKEVNT